MIVSLYLVWCDFPFLSNKYPAITSVAIGKLRNFKALHELLRTPLLSKNLKLFNIFYDSTSIMWDLNKEGATI